MTVKIVVDVWLWALAAKTLYRPVNLLWPWTSNLESITSKSWDSPVKTSKTVSILIAETFLPLQPQLSNHYFQKSWSALWQDTILPKETEPTPKADRNRPLRLDPTQIRYFPDIDLISFDDWTMPFTGSNCPAHMSVELKWCFLNWSKGGTGIFIPVTMSQIRGYVTPNQIHLLFGIFVKKCAKTTQNKASIGLIWFGNNLVMIQGVPWHVWTTKIAWK